MENVKCQKCDREFSEQPNEYPGKVYVHHGKVICEPCLLDMGVMPDTADPEKTYLHMRADLYRVIQAGNGLSGLNENPSGGETRVYEARDTLVGQ